MSSHVVEFDQDILNGHAIWRYSDDQVDTSISPPGGHNFGAGCFYWCVWCSLSANLLEDGLTSTLEDAKTEIRKHAAIENGWEVTA